MKEAKNSSKIFMSLIIIEAIIVLITSFYSVDWPNSCTPDLFHPFGRINSELLCAQVITPTLPSIFFLSIDFLISTIVIYSIYLLIKKK